MDATQISVAIAKFMTALRRICTLGSPTADAVSTAQRDAQGIIDGWNALTPSEQVELVPVMRSMLQEIARLMPTATPAIPPALAAALHAPARARTLLWILVAIVAGVSIGSGIIVSDYAASRMGAANGFVGAVLALVVITLLFGVLAKLLVTVLWNGARGLLTFVRVRRHASAQSLPSARETRRVRVRRIYVIRWVCDTMQAQAGGIALAVAAAGAYFFFFDRGASESWTKLRFVGIEAVQLVCAFLLLAVFRRSPLGYILTGMVLTWLFLPYWFVDLPAVVPAEPTTQPANPSPQPAGPSAPPVEQTNSPRLEKQALADRQTLRQFIKHRQPLGIPKSGTGESIFVLAGSNVNEAAVKRYVTDYLVAKGG